MRGIRLIKPLAIGLVAAAPLLLPQPAQAVPSFAQQTGQPCTACHVGAFGPQLTAFGRAFKITGYTLAGGTGPLASVPLAGFVLTSFTHTQKDQSGPASAHFGKNDNFAVDQISLFLAHRISDHVGMFMQTTYNGISAANPDPAAPTFKIDNTDIRIVTPLNITDDNLIIGASINNGPTVQDPYNSSFAWGVPYVQSVLAPTPAAAPLIAGALNGNTIGSTVYAWYDNSIYAEFGFYQSMNASLAKTLGTYAGPGLINGLAPYARLAYEWNWAGQSAHIGLIYLGAALEPGYTPGVGTDKYQDVALDGSYQWIGDGSDVVTLFGIYTHENQQLDSTFNSGGSSKKGETLDQFRMNVSWFHDATYGLTLGVQKTWGNADPILYAANRTGKPDSLAFLMQADWIPFGKDSSWGRPLANLKLGLQYIYYPQFNGAASNYDGAGANSGDNNTLYAYAWLAF